MNEIVRMEGASFGEGEVIGSETQAVEVRGRGRKKLVESMISVNEYRRCMLTKYGGK